MEEKKNTIFTKISSILNRFNKKIEVINYHVLKHYILYFIIFLVIFVILWYLLKSDNLSLFSLIILVLLILIFKNLIVYKIRIFYRLNKFFDGFMLPNFESITENNLDVIFKGIRKFLKKVTNVIKNYIIFLGVLFLIVLLCVGLFQNLISGEYPYEIINNYINNPYIYYCFGLIGVYIYLKILYYLYDNYGLGIFLGIMFVFGYLIQNYYLANNLYFQRLTLGTIFLYFMPGIINRKPKGSPIEKIVIKYLSKNKDKEIVIDTLLEKVYQEYIKSQKEEIKLDLYDDLPTADDGLNRGPFVDDIYKVTNWFKDTQVNSYSIGIVGERGEGKTSVIEILKQKHLQYDPKLEVLEFSPWYYDKDKLLYNFFHEIAVKLGIKNIGFNSYEKLVAEYLCTITDNIKIPGAGIVTGLIKMLVGTGDESLENIRKKISQQIEEKLDGRTLIIVIDDLDRCSPKEILMMLNLIKNIGNLDNVLYLISYDKSIIEKILVNNGFSKTYLDKIVNLEMVLPKSTEIELKNYIQKECKKIVQNINEQLKIEIFPEDYKKYFTDIDFENEVFKFVLDDYSKSSFRKIKKFLNLFQIEYLGIINMLNFVSNKNDDIDINLNKLNILIKCFHTYYINRNYLDKMIEPPIISSIKYSDVEIQNKYNDFIYDLISQIQNLKSYTLNGILHKIENIAFIEKIVYQLFSMIYVKMNYFDQYNLIEKNQGISKKIDEKWIDNSIFKEYISLKLYSLDDKDEFIKTSNYSYYITDLIKFINDNIPGPEQS